MHPFVHNIAAGCHTMIYSGIVADGTVQLARIDFDMCRPAVSRSLNLRGELPLEIYG
jgi:hypothetical protein